MVSRKILLAAVLLWSTAASASSEVERFRLENGLTVLVRVEPRLPLVNVTALYRVGGANEQPGITGIAHYVEHMAFRGTEEVSSADITGTIDRIGGRWNGYTWIDQTLYAATVPAWALDTILHLEAERMSRTRFDPAAFERERTSIIAELQGYENDPATVLWDLTVATSFLIHPYRYNVIGWLTDVLSIRRDEAYRFYKDLYGPNNAVIAIVGDVDPSGIREKVEAHFGAIAPSPRSAEVRVVEPPQRGEKRLDLRRPGNQKNLLVVFRAPKAADPDFAVLLVVDAVIAGGRGLGFGNEPASPSSPLQEAVESAGGLTALTSLTPSRVPYVYAVGVQALAVTDLRGLEDAVRGVLDRLGTKGPGDSELARAKRQVRANAAYEVDTLAESAHRLAYYEALDGWELADGLLEGVTRVTAADVRRYIGKYMEPRRQTVGYQAPGELEGEPEVRIPEVEPSHVAEPAPSPVPDRALEELDAPPLPSGRNRLGNGVVLRAVSRDADSAFLYVRLAFGSELDPPGKEGLAMLATRTALEDAALADRLAERGARLTCSTGSYAEYSNREYVDLSIRFLPDDLHTVIGEVAGAFQKRVPRTETFERVRLQQREEAALASDDATWVAKTKGLAMLDPARRAVHGNETSLDAVVPEDVNTFLATHLVGGAVTVGLACPGETETLLKALADAFHTLPAGEAPSPKDRFRSSAPVDTVLELVPMEGKTQAEIAAGLPGLERSDPDYLSLQLLVYILGETGYAGRLAKELVDTGLAYSVYTVPQFGRLPGPLLIETSTATVNLEDALSRIRAVIRDLGKDGVTERELREAQAFRLGRMTVGIDSGEGLVQALVDAEYFGEDGLDFRGRSRRILSMTREQLNEVARRYLRPDLLRIAVAGAIP